MTQDSDIPSPWVVEHLQKVPPGGWVLDIAAGTGRHTHHAVQRGYQATAVDININRLDWLQGNLLVELVQADLENDPWPLADRTFDAVIVTNYLWRPIMPQIIAAVAPKGVLIYETFALGKPNYGGPSNPDFLLHPGELLDMVKSELTVLSYGHGAKETGSKLSYRQQICAARDIYEED